MAYTKEELLRIDGFTSIDESRKKIVGINVFDYIDDLKISERVLNSIEYTEDIYKDYLASLNEFSKNNLRQILQALKAMEVIDNHSLERENYDLLRAYSENHHSTAVNYLIRKLYKEQGELNATVIKKAHEILMRGTSNEDVIGSGYRKNNNHVVGYQDGTEKTVLYFPISYDEIEQAMKLFIQYGNSPIVKEEELFIKPIIMHGLLAVLQVFPDGNTRLARTLQHLKLFQTTNQLLDNNFELPAIYFSKTYIPYRAEYRDLIAKIAVCPDEDNWNNWILFNLKRLQDQIYANEGHLSRTRKH